VVGALIASVEAIDDAPLSAAERRAAATLFEPAVRVNCRTKGELRH
jgi:hypothetical protein